MTTRHGKGPLRLMADEVEQTLIPALAPSGLSADPDALNQGKWDRVGYEWQLKFDDPAYNDLRCRITVSRKKSTVVAISLVSKSKPLRWQNWFHYNSADWPALGSPTPTAEQAMAYWQRRLFSRPLSRIGQSLFMADNLPGLWTLKYEDRLWLRLMVWVGTLPWLMVALLGLAISVPILGYAHRGEASPSIKSGQRQKQIALRMARELNTLFRSGVPHWLFEKVPA